MSIVSSSYSVIATNLDGSRIVREVFVDSSGAEHEIRRVASASEDMAASVSQHVALVEQWLADAEAQEVLNG